MRRFLPHGVGIVLLVAACVVARTLSFAVITGGSMTPTLLPGDVCIVLKTARVAPNDLMLFDTADGKQVVVHRIVSAGAEGIRTKGDANTALDRDPVSPRRIRGRVLCAVRLGRLLAWLDSTRTGTLRSQLHSGDDGEASAARLERRERLL